MGDLFNLGWSINSFVLFASHITTLAGYFNPHFFCFKKGWLHGHSNKSTHITSPPRALPYLFCKSAWKSFLLGVLSFIILYHRSLPQLLSLTLRGFSKYACLAFQSWVFVLGTIDILGSREAGSLFPLFQANTQSYR